MKKVFFSSLFIFCVISSLAFAQSGRGKNRQNRLYDVDKVITFQGKVISLSVEESTRGGNYSVVVNVKTDTGIFETRLGPDWFIEENDFDIDEGDSVEVTGSKVNIDGRAVILAATVKNKGKVLKLRENDGTPLWRGKGRGRNR